MSISQWSNITSIPPYLRDEVDPYSLPLILHLEKDVETHPSHEEALLATVSGIITLFDDPRSQEEWKQPIDSWINGRIRKVARRARGAAWDKVQELPGVTVDFGKAQLRVLLPHPVEETPIEVKKLQVAGLDLPKTGFTASEQADVTLSVSLNPDVPMTTGKSMAQIGHATQLAIFQSSTEQVKAWESLGSAYALTEWDVFESWTAEVQDAGFTEVAPGTYTSRGTIN
jgi:peptidyl-tRNA hydrolase